MLTYALFVHRTPYTYTSCIIQCLNIFVVFVYTAEVRRVLGEVVTSFLHICNYLYTKRNTLHIYTCIHNYISFLFNVLNISRTCNIYTYYLLSSLHFIKSRFVQQHTQAFQSLFFSMFYSSL